MCNFKKRRLTLALLCYTVATFERAAGGACEQQRAGRMAVFNDRRGHKNAHSTVRLSLERQPQAAGPLSTGFTVWDAGPLEVSQVLHLSLDSTHNFGSEILYFSLWGGSRSEVFLNFFGHQSQSAFCPVEALE